MTENMLFQALQSLLTQITQDPSLTPGFDAAGRVLAVEESPQGQKKVRIASDGLTLDQKIQVERQLLRLCQERGLPVSGINFARTSQQAGSGAAPAPIKRSLNAFGIEQDKRAIPGVRHVVVVASGKGGVGKSTVSSNLAVALSMAGLRVGLMDCDVYGPSAPLLLGIRGQIEVGPNGKLEPMIGHGVKTVSFGFLSDVKSPVIWRGPLVSKAVEQLCYEVNWGDIDVMIVDMPPGTGDVQLTIAERLPVHAAVVVTTPQDVALIDAHKAVSMFERLEVPIAGVVENMAWHECRNCGHQEHIFGTDRFAEFCDSRRLQVLARLPLQTELRIASDEGKPAALDPNSIIGAIFQRLAEKIGKALHLDQFVK